MTRGYVVLGEIAAHLPRLVVACSRCDRRGEYDTAKLVARWGPDKPVPEWLRDVSADCPRRRDPHPSIYELCGIRCPQLARNAV